MKFRDSVFEVLFQDRGTKGRAACKRKAAQAAQFYPQNGSGGCEGLGCRDISSD
jgi:hypothetical protein